MQDFYDLLRIKTSEIKNIESLVNYLNSYKNNLTDRYDFLIKKEELIDDKINKNEIANDLTNNTEFIKTKHLAIHMDLSKNYYEYYEKYIQEEKKLNWDSEYYFDDFNDWIHLLEGNNYVIERIEIEEGNKFFIEKLNKKYSSESYPVKSKHNIFETKRYDEKTHFIIHLPVEKFYTFYSDFKNSKYIDWDIFFRYNSFFSTDEIFNIANEKIDFNSFIEVRKDWSKESLYLYCNKVRDINDIFQLNLNWNAELIDFVIKNYTDEKGKLSYYSYNIYPFEVQHKALFTEKQLQAIGWNIETINRYYDFITTDYYGGAEFIKEFYTFKKEWSYDELKNYREIVDWKFLSRNGSFWKNEKILNEFKSEIYYDELLFNESFKFEKHFLIVILKDKSIKNYHRITLEKLIEKKYLIDLEIFGSIDKKIDFSKKDEVAYNLVANGNLAEDLIVSISENLYCDYEKSYTHYRRCGGDLEWYISGSIHSYWQIISSNHNIQWNDNLIETFHDDLVFESLRNVRISYKTINKFLNLENTHFSYFYNTRDDVESNDFSEVSHFKSLLLTSDIYDLTIEAFLDNELRWYGLWFNENKVNNFILKKILQ